MKESEQDFRAFIRNRNKPEKIILNLCTCRNILDCWYN